MDTLIEKYYNKEICLIGMIIDGFDCCDGLGGVLDYLFQDTILFDGMSRQEVFDHYNEN